MKKFNKKGFTLIEMLVVIAVIAVLVSIVIPTVSGAGNKAKYAANAANLRSAQAELITAELTGGATDSILAKYNTSVTFNAISLPSSVSHCTYAVPTADAKSVTYDPSSHTAKYNGVCVECWANAAK